MRAAAEKQAQGDLRRRRIAELQEAARAGNAATMVEVVPIEVGVRFSIQENQNIGH